MKYGIKLYGYLYMLEHAFWGYYTVADGFALPASPGKAKEPKFSGFSAPLCEY
jgi:hypothetical protein